MVDSVKLSKNAQKTIDKQRDNETQEILEDVCYSLINFPDVTDVKKLKGMDNAWRHRKPHKGIEWRILFSLTKKIVDDKEITIIDVASISQRKDAY